MNTKCVSHVFCCLLTHSVLGLRLHVYPEFAHSAADCSLDDPHCSPEVSFVRTDQEIVYHLNGEPKSGTMWLEFVASALLKHDCEEDSTCKFQKNKVSRSKAVRDDGKTKYADRSNKHSIPIAEELGKKHNGGFDFSPPPQFSADLINKHVKELLLSDSTSRWLCIVRDPRDVLVSTCYHKGFKDCNKFVDEHYRNTVDWIKLRHAVFKAIGQQSNGTQSHTLFFESLKKDFNVEARRIAEFLGLPKISEADINAVQLETSVDEMKKQDEAGKIPRGGGKMKVRKGESCGFRADLNDTVVSAITKYMEASLPSSLYSRWAC